jgi:ergothioneine biosynthesis protein EgtB
VTHVARPAGNRVSRAASPWLARYCDVRARTVSLTAPLSAEDCALQSMPDASPAKWHLAHTTWFFETFVVAPRDPAYRLFDPAFKVLFNSYYNGVGDKHPRPERGLLSRPPLDAVRAYRAHVDAAMRVCCEVAAHDTALAALIELGIQHEQQHQELIVTDILHLMSRNPTRPVVYPAADPTPHRPGALEWFVHPAGIANIGHGGSGFAFDNECPRHRVWLEAFELASRPVTNGEFVRFIGDGGYRRPDLWLSLGWDTVVAQSWIAPLYWEQREGRWCAYTLQGLVDVDPDAPVTHISFFEAVAYARWSGGRLPTEFEWEATMTGPQALRHGDVWEWTSSSYAPYPGFRPAAGAIGEYNGKFMCNQYVLRGGSVVTPAGHARPTYRNFFPPDARWQWSGVRVARDAR